MKNKLFLFLILAACLMTFPGCLTCDIVTYIFTMTSPNTGTVKISYSNITSTECTTEDFVHFFDTIVNGKGIDEAWPQVTNIRKKFYEKDDMLNADISMDFTSLEAVGLYRYHESGPLMFMFWTAPFIGPNGKYLKSNGTYGGEKMPVAFWDPQQKELMLTIQIPDSLPSAGGEREVNCLVEKFRERR